MDELHVLIETSEGDILVELLPEAAPTSVANFLRYVDKDSARDEFFINAADNPELDHADESDEGFGYAVFGRVADGLDVVKKINWKVIRPRPEFPDLPKDEVLIRSIQRFV